MVLANSKAYLLIANAIEEVTQRVVHSLAKNNIKVLKKEVQRAFTEHPALQGSLTEIQNNLIQLGKTDEFVKDKRSAFAKGREKVFMAVLDNLVGKVYVGEISEQRTRNYERYKVQTVNNQSIINDYQIKLQELRNYLHIQEPRTTADIVDDILNRKYYFMDAQMKVQQMKEWHPLEPIYKSKTVSTRKEKDRRGRESYKDTYSGKYSKPARKRIDETKKQGSQVDGKLKTGYSKGQFFHNDLITKKWENEKVSVRVGPDPYVYGNAKANEVVYAKGTEVQAIAEGGVGINLATIQANTKVGDLQIDIDGPNAHAKAKINAGLNPKGGKKIEVLVDTGAALLTAKGVQEIKEFDINDIRYKCKLQGEARIGVGGTVGFSFENYKAKINRGSFNIKLGATAILGKVISINCDFEDINANEDEDINNLSLHRK